MKYKFTYKIKYAAFGITHALNSLTLTMFSLKITDEAKKNFYESFGRTEESVDDDVTIIKEWMKTQPHLPELMGKPSPKLSTTKTIVFRGRQNQKLPQLKQIQSGKN